MPTAAQMRKLALALPEVEEKSHMNHPDFRVRNKIFASLSADGQRGTLKLTPEIQSTISGDDDAVFTPAPGAWGRSGWTFVDLASVELGVLRDLLAESWQLVAPKNLVASNPISPSKPKKKAKTTPQKDDEKKSTSAKGRRRT